MKPHSKNRIILLLKVLIALGGAMIVANISLTSWSLVKFRNERVRTLSEQSKISSLVSNLKSELGRAKDDLQRTLLNTSVNELLEQKSNSIQNLDSLIHKELKEIPNQDIHAKLSNMDSTADDLITLGDRVHSWRKAYNSIFKDISDETTIGIIRARLSELRNTVEMYDGKMHLEEVILYKKYRGEKNPDALEKFKKNTDQLRLKKNSSEELRKDLAEFARVIELLNGEDEFDHLADIRENHLRPIFDHLTFTLSSLDIGQKVDEPILNLQFFDQLKVLIYGEEETGLKLPEGSNASPLGFFYLRKTGLQLARERLLLQGEINKCFEQFDSIISIFEKLPSIQTQNLSQSMEEGLIQNRTQILVIGAISMALFMWLGWFISKHIKQQVFEIEDARLEAEKSHLATQKLLEEREKSSKELVAAHKELQANEQRYRQLSASAPIGIFEITTEGTCLYTNPQWQKITGLSLGQSFGTGWMDVIHPADRDKFLKWKDVVNETTDFQLEFRILNAAKEIVWTHTYITAICSISGSIIGYVGTIEDISGRKRAAEELDKANKKLVDISRQAGMAEIATDVLHNIGNVLNSVNVSLTLVAERIRKSKIPNLSRLNAMIQENIKDIGSYLTTDPKGKQIPGYLAQLTEHLSSEQETTSEEIKQLEKNLDHIKDIVTMQQNYAKVSGVSEIVKPVDVFEDALHMHLSSLTRHDIEITKKYDEVPTITTDKHKVLQILVNLIANAKHACDEGRCKQKKITLTLATKGESLVMSVEDNGIGIKPEYIARIFAHGFTTRKHGHGFGLHSGALSAKELGGSLTVKSEGENTGATFTLELPLKISAPAPMPI